MFFLFHFKRHGLNKKKFLCKGQNGESGNVMMGVIKRGITVGMMRMWEIRVRIVGIRKIRVLLQKSCSAKTQQIYMRPSIAQQKIPPQIWIFGNVD